MKHCACVCLSWGYLVKELLLYNALKKLAIPYRSMVISVWQWIVYLLNPWSVQIKIGNIFLYAYNESMYVWCTQKLVEICNVYAPHNSTLDGVTFDIIAWVIVFLSGIIWYIDWSLRGPNDG